MSRRKSIQVYDAPCRHCHEPRSGHVDQNGVEQCLFQSTRYKTYYWSVIIKHASPGSRALLFLRSLGQHWLVERTDSHMNTTRFGIARSVLRKHQEQREAAYKNRRT